MRKATFVIGILILAVLLAGCAPGPNPMANTPGEDGEVAGFWMGLWQGFIAPVTFIISLFNKSVEVYEVHNNGGWYSFGFVLGLSVIFGGSSGGAAGSRRRRRS